MCSPSQDVRKRLMWATRPRCCPPRHLSVTGSRLLLGRSRTEAVRGDDRRPVPSSTWLGRVGEVVSVPRDGLPAGAAGAGPDAEQGLGVAGDGGKGQAGAGAFGSLRSSVQNA